MALSKTGSPRQVGDGWSKEEGHSGSYIAPVDYLAVWQSLCRGYIYYIHSGARIEAALPGPMAMLLIHR